MIAMTTRSSTSVKPAEKGVRTLFGFPGVAATSEEDRIGAWKFGISVTLAFCALFVSFSSDTRAEASTAASTSPDRIASTIEACSSRMSIGST